MQAEQWRIAADTGGTFTDAIAINDTGAVRRIKVLSSGCLRSTVLEVLPSGAARLEARWAHLPIFSGYEIRVLGADPPLAGRVRTLEHGWLDASLEKTALQPGMAVELTAHEEAPVLAARLLTHTPLDQPLPVRELRLGSTKGTNALLEGKTAPVLLITSPGLGDLPRIGDQRRPRLFELNVQKPAPLHAAVLEAPARMDRNGQILEDLTPAACAALVQAALASGYQSVAVSLMHAYRNPAHEQQLEAALRQAGLPWVSAGYRLASRIRFWPRTQTALVNASLEPVLRAYLDRVQQALGTASCYVMTSQGGLARAADFAAKDSLLSGPAGGAAGAAYAGRLAGRSRLLTLDMGGTSTDVARIEGEPELQEETRVGPVTLLSPSLAIETVAAGGGSVCWYDGDKLRAGPESAGADPGPACYGAGGPLTLTDVNLLAGRLEPSAFSIPIFPGAAEAALQALAAACGLPPGTVVQGLLEIADESMADAVRRLSVRKGYSPQEYTLAAFGGAGGLHACGVAARLGMEEILIPEDAGLLSAVGISQARIERLVRRQVLRPLADDTAAAELEAADGQALEAIRAELAPGQEPEILSRSVFIRMQGQDFALEVPAGPDMQARYAEAYRQLFGHWIGRPLEMESVQVRIAVRENRPFQPEASEYAPYQPAAARFRAGNPVYAWEQLNPGARMEGPALLINAAGTVWIAEGWTALIDAHRNARITRQQPAAAAGSTQPRQIALELFTRRFQAAAEEMGALLERVSFSVNVKERLDYSCAVLDAEGMLIANAPHIPVHLGSLGVCVRQVLKALPLGPEDVAITNHPGFGGSHLPDVTLIAPAYTPEGTLIGYVANRAHHAEIGGTRPGSMPPDARSLAEEGVVIAPTYLVRAGAAQWDRIRNLFTSGPWPSRSLAENIADLEGALAAIRAGQAALRRLAAAHGAPQVQHYMQELRGYSAGRLRAALSWLEPGEYAAAERLDDGSRLQVAVRRKPDRLIFDFTGSAPVHPGNFNATPAIVQSVVMYVLRLLIREDLPLNEGLLEDVDLTLPPGMLNPPFPPDPAACPAVVGGNTETSQRLTDTLLKALGLAACSQGTMNNLLFGNAQFGYYETIAGGTGAGPGFQGADAVHQHMTNTRITDPEVLEFRYPVQVTEMSVRRGSGGAGRWRGGDGICRELRMLEPVSLTCLAQHRVEQPYGMEGGGAGAPGRQRVIRRDGREEALSGAGQAELEAGDRVRIETPGGGGWGTPEV